MSVEVKKRRKVSKKTKKSWRKHVDTKDIDDFLEDQRLEERLGPPLATKTDSEIFAVDPVPDIQNIDTENKSAYREKLRNSEPKCYASLKPSSAVPDPIAKRNRVKTAEERKNPITRRIEATRKLKGQLKLKEKMAEVNRQVTERKKENRPKRGEFNIDVWQKKPTELPGVDNQWLTADTMRHTLASRGIGKKKIPKSVHKRPSVIPAVEIPHPGTSANPSYEDHQELLRQVAEKELKLIKEEAHLNRVTSNMFRKVTAEQKDKNWLKESSEGLPLNPEDKKMKSDEIDDDPQVKSINPPVKNRKKTLVQRRKQREQKQLAFELKKGKIEKKKIGDIYHLRFLKKNLSKIESKQELLRKKREKVQAIKAKEAKVLSKTKFEAPELDFKMPEELTGNLRSIEPAGNLLRDRFKSLQHRNIIAPSTRVLKLNKARVKKFIKPSHKIEWPPKNKSK